MNRFYRYYYADPQLFAKFNNEKPPYTLFYDKSKDTLSVIESLELLLKD